MALYLASLRGAVQIFKTRPFGRFARRERVSDASLVEAIARAERGLIDAELGGGVIKQRVARQGQGRSGGYRTVIGYRFGDFAIFLFGFAKNDRDNIEADDLRDLQHIATQYMSDKRKIDTDLATGFLSEVKHDDEN
jgi:hypothetical protein